MSSPQYIPICRYRYDPLDRLIGHIQVDTPDRQRFYCKSRLATEIQGAMGHTFVQYDNLLLAQQQRQNGEPDTTLLATDLQRSVLQTVKANHPRQPLAYSPYGYRPVESGLSSMLGFNGERPDSVTSHYLLGNGYRAFNPVLMRFNSPDSLSPFGKGGLNSYAYCLGDPNNKTDSNGHAASSIFQIAIAKKIARKFRINRILPCRRDFVNLPNNLTPTENLKITDEYLQIQENWKKISSHQDELFNLDYENRGTLNLKNLSAGAVARFNLPIDSLPVTLQKFAKTPHLPLNSSDLLEALRSTPSKGMSFDRNLLEWGTTILHPSGNMVNPATAKLYLERMDHTVKDLRKETDYRYAKLWERRIGN